jgi:undecaprenyl-diphosphatase
MNLFQAMFLGILQGATEFLPVSSSGHLVLVPWLLGWAAPGLAFDAVVHWGTALAVVAYFWRDWISLVGAAFRSLHQSVWRRSRAVPPAEQLSEGPGACAAQASAEPGPSSDQTRLAWLILLGTVPAALVGWLFEDFFAGMFARSSVAATFLLFTAALLTVSERWGRRERDLDTLVWPDALLVGLAQALAIFPGISRSGATIAAGLGRGLRRQPAARFSFLLATPITLIAGLLKVVDLAQAGNLAAQAPTLAVGFLSAGLVGLACIHFLLRYLQRRRLYPFAVYCAVAGVACLLVVFMRGT